MVSVSVGQGEPFRGWRDNMSLARSGSATFGGRRSSAAVGSLLLHAGLVALVALGFAQEPKSSGPSIVTVRLTGAPGAGAPAPTAPSMNSEAKLAALETRMVSPSSADTVRGVQHEATSLDELLGRRKLVGGTVSSSSSSSSSALESIGSKTGTGEVGDPYGHVSRNYDELIRPPGELVRAQAAACLAGSSLSSSVRIRLQLAPDGSIVGRPTVRRAALAGVDQRQRRTEARALQAVSACAPYHLTPQGGGSTVVEIELG